MQLITFHLFDDSARILDYKINYENKLYQLSNVDLHDSPVYRFANPPQRTERNRFRIEYSGNKNAENQDKAFYVLLKQHEASRYLIEVDVFETMFTQI